MARKHLDAIPLPADEDGEPTKVITVRMPRRLHAALKQQAHEAKVSVNSLAVLKLCQEMVVEIPERLKIVP